MLICCSCGNKNRFTQSGYREGRCGCSESVVFRLNASEVITDVLDNWDFETDNCEWENREADGDIKCGLCESRVLINVTSDVWERWEHNKSIGEQKGFNRETNTFTKINTNDKLNKLKARLVK